MKKLHYILLIAVALLVSNCDTDDDGFYNDVFVNATNLVKLDVHSNTYAVGEKLFVTADFPRNLTDNGTLLDAFRTTGATQFYFSYVIEKQVNASTWETVTVNNTQLEIVRGDAQNGSYVYGICVYNPVNDTYEYRVGFPLLTAGTYRLSWGYSSESTTTVLVRSLSPKKRLFLNINSSVTGLDANGFYNFTVN